ncbi:UNVERIFIED_ORG: hypothetical protein J2Y81_006692 [Paraburkholderia sediminicola]|nr:hypothetical protein [Paraburkholderia sediminicola]
MEFVPLSLLAVGFVALGSAATVLLTRWIPQPVAQLAAQHGRFVGLGEQDGRMAAVAPAVAPAVVPYRAHVQQEAMNVVRTSN